MAHTQHGRAVLQAEAGALAAAAERLGAEFDQAVDIILSHEGKVIVCGLGKSGRVAEKIAATLSSTGTPAVFLHAGEAAHGDLGVCEPGDPILLLSKSGATPELLHMVPIWREMRCPLIAVSGNPASPLAQGCDVVLDASVAEEADPSNLVPTASSAVALALGDALAVALMKTRGFTPRDFARLHPGGLLGRGLAYVVSDAMHAREEIACVGPDDPLHAVVIGMTSRPLGAACVIDPQGILLGLITDGDLRRALEKDEDPRRLTAADLMTVSPVTIRRDASLRAALLAMEDRPSQISVLPVLEPGSRLCCGLLRLHDLYRLDLGPIGD